MKKQKPTKNAVETDQQFHVRMMTAYRQREQRVKEQIKILFRDPANKKTKPQHAA